MTSKNDQKKTLSELASIIKDYSKKGLNKSIAILANSKDDAKFNSRDYLRKQQSEAIKDLRSPR